MNAKEYLKQYRELMYYVDCKYDQIRALRERATRLSPTSMFDNNGNITDKVGTAAAKIADLEAEIQEQTTALVAKQKEIQDTISQLPDVTMQIVLQYRYINGWSWRKIASKMNFSEKHVTGWLHRKALQEIEKLIPHNTF